MIRAGLIGLLMLLAPAAAAADLGKTRALLVGIGLPDAMAYSRALLVAGADDPQAMLAPPVAKRWRETAARLFDPDEVLDRAVSGVAATLSDAELAEIADFTQSPLGQRILAEERAATDVDRIDEIEAETEAHFATLGPDDADRMAQYGRIADHFGAVDQAVTGAMNLQVAIILGMQASGRLPGGALSEEDVLAFIAGQEETIRAATVDYILKDFAYTYRNLSDADISTYVEILGTDGARRLYVAVQNATLEVYIRDAKLLGRALGDGIAELEL